MAAIYDKALKRKDFSGIVDKGNSKKGPDVDGKKNSKASARTEAKADDHKPGADIGKIVNLMAGDANRVAMTTSAMYFIYGSMSRPSSFLFEYGGAHRLTSGPFELVIAGFFLYK
jgi:hypothetical protein